MATCEAVKRLGKVLMDAFCAETAKSGYAWSPDNRTAGQCAVCALFVQNLLGGDIYKVKVGKRTHYFNLIEGVVVDFTAEQFDKGIDYANGVLCDRKKMLRTEDTAKRYLLLCEKVNYTR